MSAHVLLNLLNELRKDLKGEAFRTFYLLFAASLISTLIREYECKILYNQLHKRQKYRDTCERHPSVIAVLKFKTDVSIVTLRVGV